MVLDLLTVKSPGDAHCDALAFQALLPPALSEKAALKHMGSAQFRCKRAHSIMKVARPRVVATEHCRAFGPSLHGFECLFGDLELDGTLGLAPYDRGSLFHITVHQDTASHEPHKITPVEFAIDGHVQEGVVADVVRNLQADTDCPNLLGRKRGFPPDDPTLVPVRGLGANNGKVKCRHGFPPPAMPVQAPAVC
jgi:hypothetical protein